MGDKIKEIQSNLINLCNKYNNKQKTIIISIAGVIMITIIIMAAVLMKPNYVDLITSDNTRQAAQVKNLLESEGIPYQISDQNVLNIKVDKSRLAEATLLLGGNSIPTTEYQLENVFSGGFSSTEADREKKYKLYLEDKIRSTLEHLDYVNSAYVQLSIPAIKLSVINSKEETSASVMLNLNSMLPDGGAESIARYVATAVGNATTSNIFIMDTDANMLFAGETNQVIGVGGTGGQQQIRSKANEDIINNVKRLFQTTHLYDAVEVAPNLTINFDKVDTVRHEYDVADGREEGFLDSEYTYDAEGGSVSGGIPGTDSNDEDITYQITGADGTTSTVSIRKRDYVLNETIRTTTGAVGQIEFDKSSISIVSSKYIIYDEATLKRQGLLDGITFDEFKANHQREQVEVDETLKDMVSKATGIDPNNIHITAYHIPFFQTEQSESRSIGTYLQLALAVLILGLLGFVVYKSTRPVEVTELEPELSVEALLSSTKENTPVEEIEVNDKSETRRAIEKFVDESPESAALLLRNWLNDDWA